MPFPFSVDLFFDPATEGVIRGTWVDIAVRANLPNKMANIADIRPHITLGAFGAPESEKLIEPLSRLAAEQAPFDIHLDSVGIYDGVDGVLFFCACIQPGAA